jgi:hypothetical protein
MVKRMLRRRIARLFLSATAYACVAVALSACRHTPADQAIRDTIAKMQAAGDKQDVSGVMKPVAEDFAGRGDDEINLDRKQLQQFLVLLRMQNGGEVHARLGSITVNLQGTERATADFTMLVTGGSGLIPKDGQMEQVRTGWRLDHGDWKLISADWTAQDTGNR